MARVSFWLQLAQVCVCLGWDSARERLHVPVLMQCLKFPSARLYPQDSGKLLWLSRESHPLLRAVRSLDTGN